MKYYIYFLYFCLPFFVITNDENLTEIEKLIIRKDFSGLEKLLDSENSLEIIDKLKNNRKELINLAEGSELLSNFKKELGEKKYTKWKRIGIGVSLTGYAVTKSILGLIHNSNEIDDNSENASFFAYDRLTDLGIGASGIYYIYLGITGKNPQIKLDDALKIANLLKDKLPVDSA